MCLLALDVEGGHKKTRNNLNGIFAFCSVYFTLLSDFSAFKTLDRAEKRAQQNNNT